MVGSFQKMNSAVENQEIALPKLRWQKAEIVELADQKDRQWRLRVISWLVLILLAAVQTWVNRQLMSGDGVSYLDIGDAYFKGDWHNAINAMWSPLFSWLTGAALWLTSPSTYWEYPVIHFVNFGLFLGALAAYEYFLTQLINTQRSPFPLWVVRLLGYALFGWSSLVLILIRNITADYLTAIAIFLAYGILLRIRAGYKSWISFAFLGGILGLGYLAKSPMFLLAFVFMALAFFLIGNAKEAIPRILITFFVFLVFTIPFVFVLSKHQGNLTFSDNGRLNYVWWVNGINPRHWQGGSANGWPSHPTKEIYQQPPVYEFSAPVGGTYPPWYDPSYWYEGASPRFNFIQQGRTVLRNSRVASEELLLNQPGPLLISGLFLLFYASDSRRLVVRNIVTYLHLLIPALAALCLFLLVHLEVRYVAPFVAVALMALFISTRPADKKLFTGVTIIVLAALTISIGFTTASYVAASLRPRRNEYWEVAQSLRSMGLGAGDKIATTGSGITNAAWARLAHVRIGAEVYSNKNDEFWDAQRDEFWLAGPAVRQQIIKILAESEVKALVTDNMPDNADTNGWQKVGRTDYYVYFMPK